MTPSPPAVALPEWRQQIEFAIQRFNETSEDGQDTDIGRAMLDVLTTLGLLERRLGGRHGNFWRTTDSFDYALAALRAQPVTSAQLSPDGIACPTWKFNGMRIVCTIENGAASLLIVKGQNVVFIGELQRFEPVASHDVVGITQLANALDFAGCEGVENWTDAKMIQEATTLIRRLAQPSALRDSVADGWALVPVEPTSRMVTFGFEAASDCDDEQEEDIRGTCRGSALKAEACYRAMIAVAPTPKLGEGDES